MCERIFESIVIKKTQQSPTRINLNPRKGKISGLKGSGNPGFNDSDMLFGKNKRFCQVSIAAK